MWQTSSIQSSLNSPWLVEKKQQLRGVHNHDNPGSGIKPDTVTLLTGDTLAYSPIFIKVEGWVQSRTLNEHEERKATVWHGEQGWCICGGLEPTNVTRAQIPALKPYVGWVCCWFSSLLWEVYHRVIRLSPLLKTNSSKFQLNLKRTNTFKRVHKNS